MKRNWRDRRARGRKSAGESRPGRLGFETLESRLAMAVVISEFLADNESGLTDLAGETQDWIELANTGAVAENIGGWYLTDTSADLTKWQIPVGTTIPAGGRLVIFASGKDLTGAELHTNFSLSSDGEYLGLVEDDGVTVVDDFGAAFPGQDADVSYGSGRTDAATTNVTLVDNSSQVSFLAPTGPDIFRDDQWRDIGFNTTGWQSGFGSVGKDINGDALNFFTAGWLDADSNISSTMPDSQKTAYIRYEFNVADKDQLTSLALDLRFDDGFIAYINGREVRRANFGEDFADPQPSWKSDAGHQTTSSSAGGYNRGAEVADIVHFDLTPYLEFLVEGENVLAFHGVNTASSSTTDVRDFLIQPTLTATRANGSEQTGYMLAPTPGAANAVLYAGIVGDTSFSVDRGFYDTAQLVEISTATPGATIRYTTDGSVPTLSNGITYTGAIAVDPGLATLNDGNRGVVTLRARAFKDGFVPTNTDTQTYVFANKVIYQNGNGLPASATWGHDKEDADSATGYNLDDEADWAMDPDIIDSETPQKVVDALKALPTVSLSMSWDDLFGGNPLPGTPAGTTTVAPNTQGIYIVGRSDERPASMEFFTPNGSASSQVDTAVEIQGHSSPNRWGTDKLSFQVKFKVPFGDSEWNQRLFGGTADGANATTEFDTLILDAGYNYTFNHANVVQNSVARYVTDQVVADLQNLASGGGDAPHGQWVNLYLDGVYWGIYNLHERPDDSFAAEYYGGDKDDYYVVKHASDTPTRHIYVEGGYEADAAYENLLALTEIVAGSAANDLASFQQVEGVLDVDQFIDYMTVLYYAGNSIDWSNNNWYASMNSVDPLGRWRFSAWDQEHAFPTNDNSDGISQTVNTTTKDEVGTPTAIHQNLMTNDEYRLRFSDRVQELMRVDGTLTPTKAAAIYQARLTELDQAIIAESARWGDNRFPDDPYTRLDWLRVNSDPTGDGRAVLTDFFPTRTNTLLDQFSTGGSFTTNDWLVSLAAPTFSQYGGEVTTGYLLTFTNPNAGGTIYYTTDGSDPRNAGGAIHGTAYTGPIAITTGMQIKARVLNAATAGTKNDWSPVVDRSFSVAEDPVMGLRIVELMYNPPGSADDTEYFELLNTGSQTADLTGVQITEFSTGGYTFSGGTLAAGARIVVVKSQTAFAAAYPGLTNVAAGEFSGSLANEGEIVALRGPNSELIQSFLYGDSNIPGWPDSADGDGYSLVYDGPLDGNEVPTNGSPADPFDNAANWKASAVSGGTPGKSEAPPLLGDYDRLGSVDQADYALWKSTFGDSVAPGTGADGSGNGVIDAADYAIWRNNFGMTGAAAVTVSAANAGVGAVTTVAVATEPSAVIREGKGEEAVSPAASTLGFAMLADGAGGGASGGGYYLELDESAIASQVDANLLVLRASAHDDAIAGAAAGDDVSNGARAASDSSDVAALWEDESWVARLGRGIN